MFNFSNDKKIIYILLAIMVIRRLASYMTDQTALIGLVLTIPGLLIAITFHEFAHAFAADKLGDDTPRSQGRLTLNPLAHLDPIGSVMLLFAGFGWGKPVIVSPRKYTRKMSMEKGDAIVSFAGPLMNIILAFVFSCIYCAIVKFADISFVTSMPGSIIMLLIPTIVRINIALGLFNLIPLPPLDGSKIIILLFPYKVKQFFMKYEQIFYMLFIIIALTPIASYILTKPIEWTGNGMLSLAALIFRI